MISKNIKSSIHLSHQEKNQKIIQLFLLCLPILVSFLSNFDIQISLPGCPLLHYLGIPCPGWGLTRSFQAIAQGNVLKAINFHLFGPILFIAFLSLIFQLISEILKKKHISNAYTKIIKNPTYQMTFLLMVFGYHGTRLYHLGKTGELSYGFINSPLVEWVSTLNWSPLKNLLYN